MSLSYLSFKNGLYYWRSAVNVNRNMASAANRKWQHITKQALHRYYVYIMVFIAMLDEEGLVTEAALWVELGLDKFLLWIRQHITIQKKIYGIGSYEIHSIAFFYLRGHPYTKFVFFLFRPPPPCSKKFAQSPYWALVLIHECFWVNPPLNAIVVKWIAPYLALREEVHV